MPSSIFPCFFAHPAKAAPRRKRRSGAAAWAAIVASFLLGSPAIAADPVAKPDQNLVVTTADGWNIALTYYTAKGGAESPVVVLLHMKGGNRFVWNNGFAKQLYDEGYAVIAVDLRGHGESKPSSTALAASGRLRQGGNLDLKPGDYQAMVLQDLEAVKQFIYEEHQREALNMRKMAIVAPEMLAPIALYYTVLDWRKRPYNDAPSPALQTPRGQDVRALVLVSPDENVPGMNINNAILELRNPQMGMSFYIGYGSNNQKDKAEAEKLYKKLTHIAGNDQRMYLIDYPVKLRGTDLFGQQLKLETNILTFLDKHLKQLPEPWRDRKSALAD